MKLGFIGQGYVGKNYADNFEERGYEIVRYDIDKYKKNKEKIKDCEIVFIAVPTPSITKNKECYVNIDNSAIIDALKNTRKGQIIVIKSTVMLGTTQMLQKMFDDRYIIHSPEFLTEATAKYDVANPSLNIVGYTKKSKCVAGDVMRILPCAHCEEIVDCRHSEFIKYMVNCWFYMKVLTVNMFYDVATTQKLDYDVLKRILGADRRIGKTHLDAIHKGGRGAGGHCFIKDFAAFVKLYDTTHNIEGMNFLFTAEEYNKQLLKNSKKDLKLLSGVYDVKD